MAQLTGISDAPPAPQPISGHPASRFTAGDYFDVSRTSLPPPTPPPSSSSSSSSSKDRSRPLQHHFSIESKQFSGAALKKLATPSPDSVVIPLGAGRPSADLFPWDCSSPAEAHRFVLKDAVAYDLSSVLDYGHAEGSPQLLRFVREHVNTIHNPPYADWATCLSSGSTSALEIALRIFCNRGDAILTEHYTYLGFIEVAGLTGLATHGVTMDEGGIRPESLRGMLHDWDEKLQNTKRPSVLYTIPSGQNPTGATQTHKRKQEIYDIAEQFDLVIIEDDPYYFLQLDSPTTTTTTTTTTIPQTRDVAINGNMHPARYSRDDATASFAGNLIPSYLSLDKSGRVVRLDSASKILAPGLRIGWVTANDSIIDKFVSYHEVCTAFPSGPSQLMLFNLLREDWGHQGFIGWLASLSLRYRERRDILLQACRHHLPGDICSWDMPTRGMFVWIRVDLGSHPCLVSGTEELKSLDCSAIDGRIMTRAFENGVQVTNGSLFEASPSSSSPQGCRGAVFFRLAFAAATDAALVTGVQLFAQAVRDEFTHGAPQEPSEASSLSAALP
ncbi:aromatic aminotransferase Aro8 [Coniochaeta sp. 2T2.1]|nr:aromatic aminotransferase Aro8 [Coniochaeta sp. 2T2.1]